MMMVAGDSGRACRQSTFFPTQVAPISSSRVAAGDPLPRIAYLISGSTKDTSALRRFLLALYDPRNHYILHFDVEAPDADRRDLAAGGNMRVVEWANLVTYHGPTMVASTLHASVQVCSTAMNDRSNRSHRCLTVHVQGCDLTSGTVLRGCMHLVDLASSERVDKYEVVGDRLKEAQHINKSLAALGDIIASLAQKYLHVPYQNSKLTQLLQDSLGQAKTLMFIHIAPEPDAISESISTLKFAQRVATIELGAAKTNKEGGEVKELKEEIACLKAALSRKDRENENMRSIQSSPDIYRMRAGNASPASKHPTEEVESLETRSNGTPRQKKPNFELSDMLVENDPSLWLDTCNGSKSQFGSSNSLPELGPDATHDLAFYQRSSPEQQCSWAGSVATEDSDDFEVGTTCSSEQDSVQPGSAPKATGFANGSASISKKAQPKSSKIGGKSREKDFTVTKKPNGTAQIPIKNGKQATLGGVDGRKTPNGNASTKK